jgi:DNA-binding response OmpR family regulator
MEKTQPTVLMVADEPLLRDFVADCLTLHGYTVECTDPADSLARVVVGNADLILLDLGWPEAAGLELCRRLRDELSAVPVPIVALTELPEDSRAVTGFASGPNDYLTKPFDIDALLTTVAHYCSR